MNKAETLAKKLGSMASMDFDGVLLDSAAHLRALDEALRDAIVIIDGALYCGHKINGGGEATLLRLRSICDGASTKEARTKTLESYARSMYDATGDVRDINQMVIPRLILQEFDASHKRQVEALQTARQYVGVGWVEEQIDTALEQAKALS
ncbi:hypothetical protein [Hydrogenophaga sp.]|uniref:hypothetical protein n=1 Tax=Hydrogenophaga sp. TaxID=1904254 RepID=UPI003F6EE20F